MVRLAIYDMDRTITRYPTFTPFLIYAARNNQPLRLFFLPIVAVNLLFYSLRLIDRARLKEWNQTLLVGHAIHPEKLAPIVGDFARRTLDRNVLSQAQAQLAADKAEGYRLVMATASYRMYADAIGNAVGFDDVIATNSLVGLDTRIMAKIDGENCYGPAKLRMIEAWMHDQGIDRSATHVRFYSDHVSDSPALAWADEGFAVNAHGPLRRIAVARGWHILDWD